MGNKLNPDRSSGALKEGKSKRYKHALKQIFDIFQLADFREHLEQWKNINLITGQFVNSDCHERERLLLFIKELIRLAEAFHQQISKKQVRNAKKKYTRQALKVLTVYNQPVWLTQKEIKNPGLVISRFTYNFPKRYARRTLMDMLDAVVSYEGPQPVYKRTLVPLYRQLDLLIKLAFKNA